MTALTERDVADTANGLRAQNARAGGRRRNTDEGLSGLASRSLHVSRSVSAGKGTRTAARRSTPCPHRVRAGAYCKRCEKTV